MGRRHLFVDLYRYTVSVILPTGKFDVSGPSSVGHGSHKEGAIRTYVKIMGYHDLTSAPSPRNVNAFVIDCIM